MLDLPGERFRCFCREGWHAVNLVVNLLPVKPRGAHHLTLFHDMLESRMAKVQ
jgi:hypothetical protein